MKKWMLGILFALFLLLSGFALFLSQSIKPTTLPQSVTTSQTPSRSKEQTKETLSIVAQNLEVPWALAFLPDGSLLFTERKGTVQLVDPSGQLQQAPIATLTQVKEISESGLLGIAVHPKFTENKYVYLYYTYSGDNNTVRNRVSRFLFDGNSLKEEKIMVDTIPGAPNHDGGRIKFGPDGYLYIATGDSQDPSLAQNTSSLAGKILRVTDEGQAAPGNPFATRIYSFGHRNPQGLAWDDRDQLFATEHGRSGIQSGFDELNLIQAGKNYGWDSIQGDEEKTGMVKPILHSGANTTWAPSGAAFYNGSIFFTGLRGQALYEAVLDGDRVVSLKKHFDGELGRIRDVIVGPDNFLYLATSNRDGRGIPKENDDKILRINPEKL